MRKYALLLAIIMLCSFISCQQMPDISEADKVDASVGVEARVSYVYPEYSESYSGNMTAKISGLSDGVLSYAEVEYQIQSENDYPQIPQELTASLLLFGSIYTGTYTKTSYVGYNYYPCYEYKTADGAMLFKYSPDGELVAVSRKGLRYDDSEKCSKEFILQNAENFMRQFVDTSLYRVNITYYEQYAQYVVEYVKYIGDIPTADRAELTFTPAGELAFYSSSLLGKISSQEKMPIVVDEALYLVHQRLTAIYEPIKAKCDYLVYEQPSCVITLLSDGAWALIVEADVDACTNTGYGEIEIMGSEVRFIVQ